jgi:GxxExxY protein
MNTDLNELTERIIGCAFTVSNTLGCGFLEKPYENALAHELAKSGIRVQQQVPIHIWYDQIVVGEYVADLLVEQRVLVELKSTRGIEPVFIAQCLNYLRATHLPLCLLLNFGNPKLQIKRIVLTP